MSIANVTGNSMAKSVMLSSVKSEKHGTAYMFVGEGNLGKKFAAVQFAKAMNCLAPKPDGDCCDICGNCHLIDKIFTDLDEDGMQKYPHPDALYINTEKANIVIDMVLDKLQEINSYRAVKLKKKIVIMNDSEKMNQVAGNAILKELEEPNDHVAIILIVNSLEKMIATIISRCQRIEMKRASVREVIARVKFLKPDWPDAKVDEAVMFCDGKIGDALDYEGIKEKTKYVRDIVKVISNKNDDIQGIFSKVAELETMKKAKKEDKDENTRGFLLDILRILAYIYKDILLAKLSIKDVMLTKYGLNPSEIRDYSEKKLVNILKFVESAQRDLLSNANTSLLFTDLFFNIRKEGLSND